MVCFRISFDFVDVVVCGAVSERRCSDAHTQMLLLSSQSAAHPVGLMVGALAAGHPDLHIKTEYEPERKPGPCLQYYE